MCYRFFKLFRKICALIWHDRKILFAVLCAFRCLPPEYHFGMFDEIAVYSITVRIFTEVYPVGLYHNRAFALLKEQNIRHDFRSGIRFKRSVWKPYRAKQLRSMGKIPSCFG